LYLFTFIARGLIREAAVVHYARMLEQRQKVNIVHSRCIFSTITMQEQQRVNEELLGSIAKVQTNLTMALNPAGLSRLQHEKVGRVSYHRDH
jgi:hypothetical protein